jgi:hypothetical protein
MNRTLLSVAVVVSLSAAAFGQSKGRVPAPGKSGKILIEMTRAYVDAEIGKDILVLTERETLTPSGVMGVAEVKGRWDSVELETPVVRFEGDEAFVNGRVVFKGRSPEGRSTKTESGLRIRFVREKGGWKIVSGCLGVCGSV